MDIEQYHRYHSLCLSVVIGPNRCKVFGLVILLAINKYIYLEYTVIRRAMSVTEAPRTYYAEIRGDMPSTEKFIALS